VKRILLVTPSKKQDTSFAEMFEGGDLMHGMTPLKATMGPVDLATIAALTPPEFDVDIWDEAVSGKVTAQTRLDKQYDMVGVTGYLAHVNRMLELRDEFHRRGVMTVAGGPAVSNTPEVFRGVFDVIFLGEAEFTWPQFLQEWTEGRNSSEYRQIERPDLASSPVPHWHKVRELNSAYATVGVQTTRGCPFDCDFCDVIHLFGRKPRHKPVDAVIEEIKNLERLGVSRIFFCDDNFYGDPRYAKELLTKLIPVNNSFERPIGYISQFTVNIAKDDEMMRLLSEANFLQMYVGIETPRKASLMEVNKVQNTRGDLAEDVRKIQSYGVLVTALMMVGFDNDDDTIFDELFDFLRDAGITYFRLHALHAYPGTPQTARLLQEGRVLDLEGADGGEEFFGISNVIPASMTRTELFEGFLAVQDRLLDWPAFGERILHAVRGVSYRPAHAARLNIDPERRQRVAKLIGRLMRARKPVRALLYRLMLAQISWKTRRAKNDPTLAAQLQHGIALVKLLQLLDAQPPEARALAAEALPETLRRAPWMFRDIALKIAMHRENILALDRMRLRMRKRLAIETAPGYKPKLLAAVQIPKDFKRVYRDHFVITMNWLREGLQDHRLVPEGLVRVWKDFVIRYGATFKQFEDIHMSSLKELVERTIEQGNAGQFSHTRSMAEVDNLTSFQIKTLSEQIMFSVEQDLKSEKSTDMLVNVTMGPKMAAAGAR
jgi:radical SAM superfamily enzyme YgiQ (UPF0313 family)